MEKVSEFTLGVDLGDKQSVICVLDVSNPLKSGRFSDLFGTTLKRKIKQSQTL